MYQLDELQVKKASVALLKHIAAEKARAALETGGKKELFEDAEWLSITFALIKSPTPSPKAHRISIPHPIYSEDDDVCIFTKDPQSLWKERLAGAPVSKIIGLTKLRNNYNTFEARRALASSYDLFVADSRVCGFLPALLGKAFYKQRKQPIALHFRKGQSPSVQINKARNSTYFFLSGPCCSVKVGKDDFSAEHLSANIVRVVERVVELIPKKWKGIQSIYLKSRTSIALPIFQRLPDIKIRIPRDQITPKATDQAEPSTTATATTAPRAKVLAGKRKRDEKEEHGEGANQPAKRIASGKAAPPTAKAPAKTAKSAEASTTTTEAPATGAKPAKAPAKGAKAPVKSAEASTTTIEATVKGAKAAKAKAPAKTAEAPSPSAKAPAKTAKAKAPAKSAEASTTTTEAAVKGAKAAKAKAPAKSAKAPQAKRPKAK